MQKWIGKKSSSQISALLSLNIVNNRRRSGKVFFYHLNMIEICQKENARPSISIMCRRNIMFRFAWFCRVRWRNVISVFLRSVPGVMSKRFCWYTLQIIDISCAPSVFLHRQCKIFPPFAGTKFVPNSLDEFQSRITHTRNVSLSVSRVPHGTFDSLVDSICARQKEKHTER